MSYSYTPPTNIKLTLLVWCGFVVFLRRSFRGQLVSRAAIDCIKNTRTRYTHQVNLPKYHSKYILHTTKSMNIKKPNLEIDKIHPTRSTISRSNNTNITNTIKKCTENDLCRDPTQENPLSKAVNLFLFFTLYEIRKEIKYKKVLKIKLIINTISIIIYTHQWCASRQTIES